MATHPDATLQNFPRDMQWGQGLQLIEDLEQEGGADSTPTPFAVREGDWLWLVTRYSRDGVTMQFQLERATSPDDAGSADAGMADAPGASGGPAMEALD